MNKRTDFGKERTRVFKVLTTGHRISGKEKKMHFLQMNPIVYNMFGLNKIHELKTYFQNVFELLLRTTYHD